MIKATPRNWTNFIQAQLWYKVQNVNIQEPGNSLFFGAPNQALLEYFNMFIFSQIGMTSI